MKQDWREYLARVEATEGVLRVREEIDPEYEPTGLIMELERQRRYPLIIFENIRGHTMPVVANVLASRKRLALGLSVEENDTSREYARRIAKRFPLRILEAAPFQEKALVGDAVDLGKFPILTHFPVDAGPYITAGLVVGKDPHTGVDTIGFKRMQLKGKNKLGISLHSRQRLWEFFRRAEEQGKSLETAVALGVHPNISLGSMAVHPYWESKMEHIGGLFEEPLEVARCKTVDLLVPAWAEIVLEGEILCGVREPEGPFAEFTGYASDRSTENVFLIKAIQHRHHPLYHCVNPGMCADHNTILSIHREGDIFNALNRSLPNVRQVGVPYSGCSYFHTYISIKKTAEGQPLQAAFAALGVDHHTKLVVVVDEDIDVSNEEEVWWAVSTRVQADRDVLIIPQHLGMGLALDPSSDETSRTAKMVIDATVPLAGYARTLKIAPEVGEKMRGLASKYTALK